MSEETNSDGLICAYIACISLHQCQLCLGSAETWGGVGLLELLVTVPCRVSGSVFFWPLQDTCGQRKSLASPGSDAEETFRVHESLD